jgi:fructose/tagatose bisphosphate aldolase
MPLITGRKAVLDVYTEMGRRGWVMPCFCTENRTSTEAILAAAVEVGTRLGCPDLPVTIAMTNLYSHRSQSVAYTHTGRWDIGLKLFLADLRVLTESSSPYGALRVLVHLDHIQPDADRDLLAWDLGQFSSIMYDASTLPFEQNIDRTRRFMREHGHELVVEGACDEIVDAGGQDRNDLTTPERALAYVTGSGVDFIVANLGTEHRASAAELTYHGDLARQIADRVGGRLVLHGSSSVPHNQIRHLFRDGVRKVNVWAAIERDSSPALLSDMARNAAKVAGQRVARSLREAGVLGPKADTESSASLSHYTTTYRQDLVFGQMKQVVARFLDLWMVA